VPVVTQNLRKNFISLPNFKGFVQTFSVPPITEQIKCGADVVSMGAYSNLIEMKMQHIVEKTTTVLL
jgi:hypothetical protein